MARKPNDATPLLIPVVQKILGGLTLTAPHGEKAVAPLANLLAGATLTKHHAHAAGLDMVDLVTILQREFLIPVVCDYPDGANGDAELRMLPNEIAFFIGKNTRSMQANRWRDLLRLNDEAAHVNSAVELYTRKNEALPAWLAALVTGPRRIPDINAGDSFALLKTFQRSPVEPRTVGGDE